MYDFLSLVYFLNFFIWPWHRHADTKQYRIFTK